MAHLGEEFNVNTMPKSERNFEPLPAGWYDVSISGAEVKDTKTGTGSYIAVRYAVTGPTHQGRVVFGNLNVKNANPTAEKIGREQLGELMLAIGLEKVTDSDQLIGGNLSIKLDIRKSEQYGDSNNVIGFKSLNKSTLPMSNVSQDSKKSSPPWTKKS